MFSENKKQIENNIEQIKKHCQLQSCMPQLIAVSKGQPWQKTDALWQAGQRHFAENRLQEAQKKWCDTTKAKKREVTLHLIGPLQSNKVSDAVALFDVIHTIDREKIARLIAQEMKKQNRNLDCLVQVNIGKEPQKSGVMPEELPDFLKLCREDIRLPVKGLMCIPPQGENPAPYFALMHEYKKQLRLDWLSMGMSADYETAIRFGATHIRVGTALFGEREIT